MNRQLEILRAAIGATSVQYIPNHGNAGDAVIAEATRYAFEQLGISVVEEAQTVVVAGGGNLVEMKHCGTLMDRIRKIPADKAVVLLPSSIHGKYFGELAEQAQFHGSFRILCREDTTYRMAKKAGLDAWRCPDMAFLLPITEKAGGRADPTQKPWIMSAFRSDSESTWDKSGPRGNPKAMTLVHSPNIDLSLKFEQRVWRFDEITTKTAQAFAAELACFEEVETDRLHVAIVAARMGLKVRLFANSYHKVEACYLASLRHYPNVQFVSPYEEFQP